jgi:hypothetical protein
VSLETEMDDELPACTFSSALLVSKIHLHSRLEDTEIPLRLSL